MRRLYILSMQTDDNIRKNDSSVLRIFFFPSKTLASSISSKSGIGFHKDSLATSFWLIKLSASMR